MQLSLFGDEMPFKWTPEHDKQIRDLADRGASATAIASIMKEGVTRNMVIGRAHRQKIPLGVARWNVLPKNDPKQLAIEAFYLAGKKPKEIGELVDMNPKTVGHRLRKAGLKMGPVKKTRLAPPVVRVGWKEPIAEPEHPWDSEIPGPMNCHWVVGDVLDGTLKFCWSPLNRERGDLHHKYCPAHYKLAYQPARRRPIGMMGVPKDNMRILERMG